jgi:hypothetical protein
MHAQRNEQMAQYLLGLVTTEDCFLLADFLGGQVFASVLNTLLTEVCAVLCCDIQVD